MLGLICKQNIDIVTLPQIQQAREYEIELKQEIGSNIMKALKKLCTPRSSVFDAQKRDTVLDISDMIADKISPDEFFEENYVTEGMKTLLEQGFRRLEGKSNQGVFLLKQAMGGGKTHNLLTLGLLAKHPEIRQKVLGNIYRADPNLGAVKVVAFSGVN